MPPIRSTKFEYHKVSNFRGSHLLVLDGRCALVFAALLLAVALMGLVGVALNLSHWKATDDTAIHDRAAENAKVLSLFKEALFPTQLYFKELVGFGYANTVCVWMAMITADAF
jgi:hypothetical protein